jgi:DNA-binding transcriptional regulator YiaG
MAQKKLNRSSSLTDTSQVKSAEVVSHKNKRIIHEAESFTFGELIDGLSVKSEEQYAFEKSFRLCSDNNGILGTISDCYRIINAFEDLASIICPNELKKNQKLIKICADKILDFENKIAIDTYTLYIKTFTLNLVFPVNYASLRVLEYSNFKQLKYSELKELIKTNNIDLKLNLGKVDTANFDFETIKVNLSDVLENLSHIFPEFKIPEIHYEGRGLVSNLNSMASGPPITSGCKSLRDKENWDKDPDNGLAYYEHIKHDNPNSIITHYIRDWNSDEIKALPFNEATQILDNFGSQTALLHLILAVHVYSKADPTSTKFRLKGTDLIHDLGLAKRSDLSTSQKLKIVLETVNAVRSLLIKAEWQGERKIRGKIKPVKISVEPSIMWDIVPIKITQKNLLEDDDLIELDISVRIGLWIDEFFNEAGYQMGKALYNFATLAKNILELNPYHEELALRIALLQSTMPYRSYITVEHWLEENLLGYKDRISKARSKSYVRRELKLYWDKTVLALERIGFHIHFDEESYPSQLRPNGKVPRGYFEPWLKAKIKIIPQKIGKPESAIERLERLEREAKKKLTPTKTYSGSELKKARIANKLTQEIIAKYLQCSKGTISKLEKKSEIPLKKYKEMMDAINFVAKTPEKFK